MTLLRGIWWVMKSFGFGSSELCAMIEGTRPNTARSFAAMPGSVNSSGPNGLTFSNSSVVSLRR